MLANLDAVSVTGLSAEELFAGFAFGMNQNSWACH